MSSEKLRDSSACYYCGDVFDLRPYGPKGSMVCFKCAMKTPERQKQTEQHFANQMNAIRGDIVVDGSSAGPYPAEHHPNVREALKIFRRKHEH